MCGISGIWRLRGGTIDARELQMATSALRHRGPDDEGYLLVDTRRGEVKHLGGDNTMPELSLPHIGEVETRNADLGLGFRRLAILDLSAAGHQPMRSHRGGAWLIFNGEIYNFIELREELKALGHVFSSGSDAEVILAAYEQWDVGCLSRFNGMWAFALWDGDRRRLFCARDRLGVKPFYLTYEDETFRFASEIKALLVGRSESAPNERRVRDYLAYRRLDHTDETFFAGVRQLPAAHYCVVDNSGVRIARYWDVPLHGQANLSREESLQRFKELFVDSVRLRLRSDVAVGTCLSGGMDSSSIVCSVRQLLSSEHGGAGRLLTFSSCFEDAVYDERQYIEEVNAVTSAIPHYVFPDPERLFEELPALVWHMDEPFVSTSMYAQWNVMRLARSAGVTVLLDGQGGDELLAGYPTYYGSYLADLVRSFSFGAFMRETTLLTRHGWSRYRNSVVKAFAHGLLPASMRGPALRIAKKSVQPWLIERLEDDDTREGDDAFKGVSVLRTHLYKMLTADHLPALLHYEDRNSMAFSIEARVPFLDYRLVEFIFSMPDADKLHGGLTKAILRQAMVGIVPKAILDRTDKMGFVTPEDVWFRGPLRERLRSIIASRSFAEHGYIDQRRALRAFDRHAAGHINISQTIWRWVNLELWLRRFIDNDSGLA